MLASEQTTVSNLDLENMQIALDQMSQTLEVLGHVVTRMQLQLMAAQENQQLDASETQALAS